MSVLGLAISITVSLLIFRYIVFETNYNKDQVNRGRIYRVSMGIKANNSEDYYAATGGLLGSELAKNYPAIETYASFKMFDGKPKIQHNTDVFLNERIFEVNPQAFKIFSFEPIEGELATALNNPGSIVLTRTLARKLFGDKRCLKEFVEINKQAYAVTAVIEDRPSNSDLQFDALVYYPPATRTDDEALQSYFDTDHYTYILQKAGSSERDITTALDNFGTNVINPLVHNAGVKFSLKFEATALSILHFSKPLLMDTPKGNANNLYILSLLAVFLLIIGIANFVNYNIVTSYKKAVSIGLQKLYGIGQGRIIRQFIGRSLLGVAVSLMIAILLTLFASHFVDALGHIRFTLGTTQTLAYAVTIILISTFIGCLGGIIPAYHMSNQSIARLLANKMTLVSHSSWSHKTILFLQLTISSGLIILTLELHRQLLFFNKQDLGFKTENLVVIDVPDGVNNSQLEVFRTNLLSHPNIKAVSLSASVPGDEPSKEIFYSKKNGKRSETVYTYIKADENYLNVLGIPITTGRNFDRVSDDNSVIVTRSFLNKYPDLDPTRIRIATDTVKPIVGVIGDFHQTSFHDPISPIIIGKLDLKKEAVSKVLIKADPGALAIIRKEAARLNFDTPLKYYFLSDYFQNQYARENRLLTLFMMCSFIAILVSCLGVFSISSIIVKGRSKELAIRSVLGGSLADNIGLIFKPFGYILLVVFLFVCPASFFLIQKWRENYAYSSNPSLLPYVYSLILIVILIFTNIFYLFYHFLKGKVSTLLKNE
ncbi:ABC transporter permease [Puia dinghuensis]|uniref:ABC transporter permease n=1 Tax=Puia dinghuensis TaxID=1792502 RepID=A0A8J2XQI8_9BACT|nr:ABC transporter permease [Puia dinghuensis]